MRITIIFDYGNVLSQSQPPADTQAMAGILDIPLAQFQELYWRYRVEYDAAALEPAAYWNTVAKSASRSLTPAQISTLIDIDSRSWSHPAPLMPELARALRAAGLPTAILSNMPVPVRDYILGCPWLPEFDSKTFSCEVRICKPAREIYEDCLDKLGARPSDVLFLDDRESNIRAAQALGLNTVLFTDAPRALREIEDRFSLPLVPKLAPMASNMLAGS